MPVTVSCVTRFFEKNPQHAHRAEFILQAVKKVADSRGIIPWAKTQQTLGDLAGILILSIEQDYEYSRLSLQALGILPPPPKTD